MKKFLAIVLAVAMVLSIASVAMAFNWAKPASSTTADNFGYKVEVLKFTRSTGSLGSSSFNIDSAATAVNGADVYFAIKLTVSDPDDDIAGAAEIKITGTAIEGFKDASGWKLGYLDDGVYYYAKIENGCNQFGGGRHGNGNRFRDADWGFYTISELNKKNAGPVFSAKCEDTATAEICAKVTAKSKIDMTDGAKDFEIGDYTVYVGETVVEFWKGGNKIATFNRKNSTDGKVTSVSEAASGQDVLALYRWLNADDADVIYSAIKNGEMYMSNDNLVTAFGWSYTSKSCATWNANSTPIILDPTISIPKTGDNASVIGFAMIMVAVVAAAAAMKKVKA